MRYALKLLIIKCEEDLPDREGVCNHILPSMQEGLRAGQEIFVLWIKEELRLDGGRIIVPEERKTCFRAFSVTPSAVRDVLPEAAYPLDSFNLFILYHQHEKRGVHAGLAVRAARGLMARGKGVKDILFVAYEGGYPMELYSDAGFYGIVCVSRMNIPGIINREMQTLMRPAGQEGAGDHPEAYSPFEYARGTYDIVQRGLLPVSSPGRWEELLDYTLAGIISAVFAFFVLYSSSPRMYSGAQSRSAGTSGGAEKSAYVQDAKAEARETIVALDPFTFNFAEQQGTLKMKMQCRLSDVSYHPLVARYRPQLRNAIMNCVNKKRIRLISNTGGKARLKSEILSKMNQVVGKGVFKNIYFSEFMLKTQVQCRSRSQPAIHRVMVAGRRSAKDRFESSGISPVTAKGNL